MRKTMALVLALLLALACVSTAWAATPSVTSRQAPVVVVVQQPRTTTTTTTTTTPTAPKLVVTANEITITPVTEADLASPDVSARLKTAYQDALTAAQANPNNAGAGLLDMANATARTAEQRAAFEKAKEQAAGVSLAVRDVFDFSLKDGMAANLVNGATVDVTLDAKIPSSETLIVMIYTEADGWQVLPEECVQRGANGSVTLTLDKECSVAFLTGK